MFRCHQRRVGVRFHPDCPDHVKERGMQNLLSAAPCANTQPRTPLCDREWIHPVDERIPGWWFPFFGFISDSRMRTIRSRILDILRKTNPFRKP